MRKVLTWVPKEARTDEFLLPPPLQEGPLVLTKWRNDCFELVKIALDVFVQKLMEANIMTEKDKITRSWMQNKNSKINKIYLPKDPNDSILDDDQKLFYNKMCDGKGY